MGVSRAAFPVPSMMYAAEYERQVRGRHGGLFFLFNRTVECVKFVNVNYLLFICGLMVSSMRRYGIVHFVLTLLVLLTGLNGGLQTAVAEEARRRVLVVFSYEEDYLWEQEIREGLERTFGPEIDLSYFYMRTKDALDQGAQKAAEAYELYRRLQPDGVIAVDDNAQSLFVVPYLKNRVSTPVVFCGVNAEPEAYGYPAANVTGILERYHLEETLSFSRQLTGELRTFALMVNESPLADLIAAQLETETERLSARAVAVLRPSTLPEALRMARTVRDQVDLLLLTTLKGVVDADGLPVSDYEALSAVVAAFDKPTAATAEFAIKSGALSGVLASGQEQGHQAARMLLQALDGRAIDSLPITRNYRGIRILNVTTLKNLNIIPDPLVLRGVKLVTTEPRTVPAILHRQPPSRSYVSR